MSENGQNLPERPEKTPAVKRVLIFVPRLSLEGGIANYYRMIKDFLPGEYCLFEKSQARTLPGKLLATVYDLLRFVYLLYSGDFQVVCLNPSLKPLVVKREAVYAFIAKKLFRKKLVIFWHGWREDYAMELEKNKLPWFKKRYFCADKMLVLISQVRQKLISWGYSGSVAQVVTCFEESYADLSRPEKSPECCRVLFLARAEKDKGLMETLQAYKLARAQSQTPLALTIAGDGSALAEAQAWVRDNALEDVEFAGYVRGSDKLREFMRGDIFIQPSYSEGLPCAMLEAMVCGLAVVTSQVGGIPDFFENEKMGFMLNTLEPEAYAEKLVQLAETPEMRRRIALYNCSYAKKHFCASQAAALECAELSSVMPDTPPVDKAIPDKAWSNSRMFLLLSLGLTALTVAVFAFVEYHNSRGLLSRDGYSYLLYTQMALEESWSAALERYPDMIDYPPGLVMLMYGAGRLGLSFELVGRVANLLGILLASWGVLFLSRQLYRDKVMALCCALITAGIPKIYMEGCNVLRDPLYWTQMIWSVVFLINAARCRSGETGRYFMNMLGVALCCAAGCITRKEGIFLTLLIVLVSIGLMPQKRSIRLAGVLVILLAAALFILLPVLCGVPWDIAGSLQRGLEGR